MILFLNGKIRSQLNLPTISFHWRRSVEAPAILGFADKLIHLAFGPIPPPPPPGPAAQPVILTIDANGTIKVGVLGPLLLLILEERALAESFCI